ncbi:glycerophosphodiester phosphodiesterase family protein [Aureimonas sp. AU12]|uniref:glycerophosphodiester phosphodiesterase family protein n=1 Tax=Aureimonas sp. AU12 TaxID=1638161 RepID=UPI00078401DB|nr:glycerophosphodiester phosphodiesterase family protein [Aureimonas sp. AU12]
MISVDADIGWLRERPIAHRGLHDANRLVCENSLAAFRAAIDGGFAIECDVRLSRDGVPVVFHDESLSRLTTSSGNVRDLDATDLGQLRLGGTEETIPTLREALALVNARVPLVVELKGISPEFDGGFLEAVAAVIDGYEGRLALMSFDEWLIEQSGAAPIKVPVGLTAEGTRADILERHRVVFERHCSFVSYNVHHLPNPFVEWVRTERHRPVISWTVRRPDDVERSERYADQMTFEGFLPS